MVNGVPMDFGFILAVIGAVAAGVAFVYSTFVPKNEYEKRIDRIESKIDQILSRMNK